MEYCEERAQHADSSGLYCVRHHCRSHFQDIKDRVAVLSCPFRSGHESGTGQHRPGSSDRRGDGRVEAARQESQGLRGRSCPDLIDLGGIHYHHLFELLGHGSLHLPTGAYCLLIALSRRTRGSRKSGNLKIGVILKQSKKTLTDHTGSAYNADLHLFHNEYIGCATID